MDRKIMAFGLMAVIVFIASTTVESVVCVPKVNYTSLFFKNLKTKFVSASSPKPLTTPFSVEFLNTNAQYIYVSDPNNEIINKYDRNGTFLAQKSYPTPFSMSSSNDRLFALTGDFDLTVLDDNLNVVTSKTGLLRNSIHYDKIGERLFLGDYYTSSIHVYDKNLVETSQTFSADATSGIGVYNDLVYLASSENQILVYRNKTLVNTVNACDSIDSRIFNVDVNVCENVLLIPCEVDKKIRLFKIDGINLTKIADIATFGEPLQAKVDSNGRLVYVHIFPASGFTILE